MKAFLMRFLKRLKVDRWIAEGAPVYWFLAISCVLCGAALGFLYLLFLVLDWRVLAVATSWVIAALTICLLGCMVWFISDALSTKERPMPWRKLR